MNLSHWRKGGTGITNFDPKDETIYHEAIYRSGYSRVLTIRLTYMEGSIPQKSYSLHYATEEIAKQEMPWGLTPFWECFDIVKAEHATRKVAALKAKETSQKWRADESANPCCECAICETRPCVEFYLRQTRSYNVETTTMVSDGETLHIVKSFETVIETRKVRL